jgi:hypothetical protein
VESNIRDRTPSLKRYYRSRCPLCCSRHHLPGCPDWSHHPPNTTSSIRLLTGPEQLHRQNEQHQPCATRDALRQFNPETRKRKFSTTRLTPMYSLKGVENQMRPRIIDRSLLASKSYRCVHGVQELSDCLRQQGWSAAFFLLPTLPTSCGIRAEQKNTLGYIPTFPMLSRYRPHLLVQHDDPTHTSTPGALAV